MHHFFKSPFFDFEVVRILGMTAHGGAEVAEVLEAVGQIKDADPKSWERAWTTQAVHAAALAEQAQKSGDRVACRQAYLRASNYTRASSYMLTGEGPNRPDPRLGEICERVHALFRRAAPLLDCEVRFVDIPFERGTLPGHLYLPAAGDKLPGRKIPLLISTGGADALQEELYYLHPSAGPHLGYAVLTFEGPGQGLTLRRDNIKMRPDWEVVTNAVLGFLESYSIAHPELALDTARIAIAGASLGGYFALRGASDPRIKACVALDPLYSFWDFATAHVSPALLGAWERGWLSDGFIDFVIRLGMKTNFQMRWEVGVAGTFFGIESPAKIMQEMKRYTLGRVREKAGEDGESFLEGVMCPVLVSGASESLYLEADHHTMRVFNALTHQKDGEKELWMANTPGQGSLQAKMGALQLANYRTFKFLDEKLDIKRPSILEESRVNGRK